MSLQARTRTGGSTKITAGEITRLGGRLRGSLILEGDRGYGEACRIYNAMIEQRPVMIARCVDAADVVAAVDFARDNDVLLAVRGGGHNGPGLGTCEGGLVIDLSPISYVRVDPEQRTARVGGGAVWGAVDHAAHAFGLATVSGIISTTGVGGLTLGGGHGYLTRKYGLTVDNLIAADVVLADGRLVTASADRNPDLFWALRGGGGNFGVATSFQLRLHPVSTVVAGPIFWDLDQAAEAMRTYRAFMQSAPEDVYAFFAFLTVPPAPPFPEALHGRKVCGVVCCHLGDQEAASRDFRPLLELGPPLLAHLAPMPYPALQSMHDPLYPPGQRWYWKGDFLHDLTDEAIALHVQHAPHLPTPQSTVHLYPIDGAVHRTGATETAFRYRDARFSQVIVGVHPDPSRDGDMISWTRAYWSAIHPHSAGGGYVNFLMDAEDEGSDRVRATYRESYDRLVDIKTKYDPANLFRRNQNIPPREQTGDGEVGARRGSARSKHGPPGARSATPPGRSGRRHA